jgi:hypothetical protein
VIRLKFLGKAVEDLGSDLILKYIILRSNMVITLTPEIEKALHEIAEKQGTTVELVALKTLRERLFTSKPQSVVPESERQQTPKTLADFLTGYTGVLDSSEFGKDGVQMSKNTGKKLADILLEKRRQGRL